MLTTEKSKNLALGVFILAISIGGFLFINPSDAPVSTGVGGVSWRTLPFIYSGLLFVLACLFIGSTLWWGDAPDSAAGQMPTTPAEASDAADAPDARIFGMRAAPLRRVAVVLLLIVYSQALGAFGFALSTPLFLFALLFVFGKTKLVENIFVALIGGFALWFLFAHLLRMPLRGAVWDPLTPVLNHALKALGI